MQVNVLEATADLSRLIRLVETGDEECITVARNGRPVAQIIPYRQPPISRRIGVAKGKFTMPDDFDADNEQIAAMLTEGDI